MNFIPKYEDIITEKQAREMNPLVLAYVGDSVQMLTVKTRLAVTSDGKANALHRATANVVKAVSQAKKAEELLPLLTDAERDIYRRARNSKANTIPKHASIGEYKCASGLEAVIGYLYLTGQSERLDFILSFSQA